MFSIWMDEHTSFKESLYRIEKHVLTNSNSYLAGTDSNSEMDPNIQPKEYALLCYGILLYSNCQELSRWSSENDEIL